MAASPAPEPAPSTLATDASPDDLDVAQVRSDTADKGAANPPQYLGVRIGDAATISGIVVGGSVTGDINIYMASSRADALKAAATVISSASGPHPSCPYPGMVPFRPEDARFFYGREGEIEEMVLRLRGQDFLLVIGPSGSGKSSLVFAGLLPKLATSPDWPPNYWRVVTMRPGAEPMARLAEALGGNADNGFVDPALMVKELLMAHPPAQRLLLVVDQFEELFTFANPEKGTGTPEIGRQREIEFIAALKALRALGSCAVVLTMRADFYHDLMSSALWPVEEGARVEIAPLQGDALCAAIEEPAADVGVEIEERLLERLLADAADQPGSLPLLQETLVLLWGRIEGRTMTLDAYERLGRDGRSGLAVAMSLKGDSVLATLSPERQDIARRIFLRLTQFGEGRPDTRRQQPVTALISESDPPALFGQVLVTLADNRLLTLSGDEQDAMMKVDLAHEALIRDWPTLRNWIAERRGAEQIRRRLESKTEEWVRLGQKTSGLLDEGELSEAEHWLRSQDAIELGASADLHSLVAASRAVISAARRRRWLVALAAVLTAVVIASAAVIVAFDRAETAQTLEIRRQQAVQAQATSEAQERKARSHALAANAVAQSDINPDRSLLLSIEAISVTREYGEPIIPQAEEALRLSLEESHVRQTLSGHTRGVTIAVWSPDGKWIATASYDGTARVWDSANGQERATLRGHTASVNSVNSVNSVAWSPDGKWIATGSDDGTARVWDATNGQERATFLGHTATVISAAWSPDGRWVATGSYDGTARVWDATNGQERATLRGHTEWVNSAAWSPDGRWVATGSYDGTARVWDATNGQERATLRGHTEWVNSAAWSPDGRWIATGSDDGTAKVWDATNGQERATLRGHTERVTSVAWSPDGRWIATASLDGTVQKYVATIEDLLAIASTRVTRSLTPEERFTFLNEPLPTPTPQGLAIPTVENTPSP
jgi:WD40 repeat protein